MKRALFLIIVGFGTGYLSMWLVAFTWAIFNAPERFALPVAVAVSVAAAWAIRSHVWRAGA